MGNMKTPGRLYRREKRFSKLGGGSTDRHSRIYRYYRKSDEWK